MVTCPMYLQIDNAAATGIKECLVDYKMDLTTETILYILLPHHHYRFSSIMMT